MQINYDIYTLELDFIQTVHCWTLLQKQNKNHNHLPDADECASFILVSKKRER